MMSPSQLADLLLSPLTTDYMLFMMARMQSAMAYHRYWGAWNRAGLGNKTLFGSDDYSPR